MDFDSNDGLLASLGLKFVTVLAGAVTAFVSLRFFEGLSVWEKWTTFLGGWALAAWGAAPLTEYFDFKPKMEVAMALILGLFGMSLTAAIVGVIKETRWGDMLKTIVDFLLRRRNGG